jgi:hypothetical protein
MKHGLARIKRKDSSETRGAVVVPTIQVGDRVRHVTRLCNLPSVGCCRTVWARCFGRGAGSMMGRNLHSNNRFCTCDLSHGVRRKSLRLSVLRESIRLIRAHPRYPWRLLIFRPMASESLQPLPGSMDLGDLVRGCRRFAPQPPANCCHPSGVERRLKSSVSADGSKAPGRFRCCTTTA